MRPHPCHQKGKDPNCLGTCRLVGEDYGSLGSGGSYDVYECDTCGKRDYSPIGD